jgi:hypothetical protein
VKRLWVPLVALAACGSPVSPDRPDAADDDVTSDSAMADAVRPPDPFWPPCGAEEPDFAFVDAGAPFEVARDGTMYASINYPGTVIGRKRPGQTAELAWLTVSDEPYAVEALVDGPGGTLIFAGHAHGVRALYRVDPTAAQPTVTQLGPAFTGTKAIAALQYTGERLYVVVDQDRDLQQVDLDTGARTAAVHHPDGILHFVFGSSTLVYLTSLNEPLTAVTLDAAGSEIHREAITVFDPDTVYKVGIDQKGRLYGMTFPHGFELLDRVDTDGTRTTIFGGNLRWSDWTFGRGALRCDLLITSQNSPITSIEPGDQTPAWP